MSTFIVKVLGKSNKALYSSLVPRLFPRANERMKVKGGPGKIYHLRNVTGRENLITCGWTNELTHTWYTCSVMKALWLTEWD